MEKNQIAQIVDRLFFVVTFLVYLVLIIILLMHWNCNYAVLCMQIKRNVHLEKREIYKMFAGNNYLQ